jgi:hypothetical protein
VGVVTPSPVDVEVVVVDVVVDVVDGGIPKSSSIQYESPGMRTHDAPTEGFYYGQRKYLLIFWIRTYVGIKLR